jgi:hypothetical protein
MKKKLDGSTSEGSRMCNVVHAATATTLNTLIEAHPEWDETSIAAYMELCMRKFAGMPKTMLVNTLPVIVHNNEA